MSQPMEFTIICDVCKTTVTGVRYKCVNCVDFDMCSTCELNNPHNSDHAFVKLTRKTPIPLSQVLIPFSLYTLQAVEGAPPQQQQQQQPTSPATTNSQNNSIFPTFTNAITSSPSPSSNFLTFLPVTPVSPSPSVFNPSPAPSSFSPSPSPFTLAPSSFSPSSFSPSSQGTSIFGPSSSSSSSSSSNSIFSPTPAPSNISSSPSPSPSSSLSPTPTDFANLAKAGVDFGFNILRECLNNSRGENVFISPFSISTCLLLVANGAIDVTLSEIMNTLGLGNINLNTVNSTLRSYLMTLNNSKLTTISVANSIWFDASFIPIKESYKQSMQYNYNADVYPAIDQNQIDQWVRAKTNGKIDSVHIPQNKEYLGAVLINAGEWMKRFTSAQFPSGAHAPSLEWARAQYMNCNSELMYFEDKNEGLQAVAIPYKENAHAVVVLPHVSKNIENVASSITFQNWTKLLQSMTRRTGTITMPKFKFSCSFSLRETLQKLGINRTFTSSAQIPNIIESNSKITEIVHKTFVDCNEIGTEAAAITASFCFGSGPSNNFSMQVTRPFIFAICDVNGPPLFIGVINKPIYQ